MHLLPDLSVKSFERPQIIFEIYSRKFNLQKLSSLHNKMSIAVESPSATPKPIETPSVDAKNSEGKATSTGEKPAKKRVKKKSKRQPRKNTLKTKVVVRRLPPNLPEKIFFNAVKPWISEETTDYSLYVPGKLSKRYIGYTYKLRAQRLNLLYSLQ